MAKKKKVKKTISKTQHEVVDTKKEKPLIELNKSTAITAGIFLLIGLIVGALFVGIADTNYLKSVSDSENKVTAELKNKVTSYLNDNFMDPSMAMQGMTFVIEETDEKLGNTIGYEVFFNIDGMLQPTGSVIYLSGESFTIGSNVFNLNKSLEENLGIDEQIEEPVQTQPPSQETLTQEQQEEIFSFHECLAEKGVKVYGANWCGFTNQLAENLGGYELITPIYVECTKEKEICDQEQIGGYPTIKINGEKVSIERTFDGFAQATGCEAPKITFSSTQPIGGSC